MRPYAIGFGVGVLLSALLIGIALLRALSQSAPPEPSR